MKSRADEVRLKIDGESVRVPAGTTVLEAAETAEIYIPTLCYLKGLSPYGGCRLCIVEIKDRKGYPTACTTQAENGMVVVTNTKEIRALRRQVLALTLSEHPYTCLICADKHHCSAYMHTTRKATATTGCNFCSNNGICEVQELVEHLELTDIPYPISYRGLTPDKKNPFFKIDYNLCVLCGRCVRICNEERNSAVLSFVNRGGNALVGTAFNQPHLEAGCEFCGACVDVCPTGAISEKIGRWAGLPERSTTTTCPYCSVGCTMNINSRGKRIVNVGPLPHQRIRPHQLCVRGKFTVPDLVHHPDRIRQPMIRNGDRWVETSWNEAVAFAVDRLERFRGSQFAAIGSPQASLEENYLLQKFSRKVMRSNNVDLLNAFRDPEVIHDIHRYYGRYPGIEKSDIENADTILVLGAQAFDSHPIIESNLRKASRAGRQVIAVNTHPTRTTGFASHNLYLYPGTAYAFLLALLTRLSGVRSGSKRHSGTVNGKRFSELDFEHICEIGGIDPEALKRVVNVLKRSDSVVILAGDQFLRAQDQRNVLRAIVTLHLYLKKPERCGIVFLSGEGNIYGGALAGMTPACLPGFSPLSDKKDLRTWSENWRTELSGVEGLPTHNIVNSIRDDGITALWVFGNVPDNPNLANLKFLAQQNLFFTESSKYAHVFFPTTSFTETDGHFLDFERELKTISKVVNPAEDIRSLTEFLPEIAAGMLEHGFDYRQPSDIFAEMRHFIDFSFEKDGKFIEETPLPLEIDGRPEGAYPVQLQIQKNYCNYFGNLLSKRIPEMEQIRNEGVVFVSDGTARKLGIENGDCIKIETEFGEAVEPAGILGELPDDLARFVPGWRRHPFLGDGLAQNPVLIGAKLERVPDDKDPE